MQRVNPDSDPYPARPRRALLYTPGDDLRKIQKAATLGVDCLCLDLEDGVAAGRKEAARATVAAALSSLDFADTEILVRLNPVGSELESADLAAVLPGHPHGLVLPKVESAEQLRWLDENISAHEGLSAHEHSAGWPAAGLGILAVVETARGIVNLPAIATATPRLQALIFGAEDLASDLGAQRTPAGWEVFYARSALVLHAAAAGLQAIDLVYLDFNDLTGLEAEALQGAQLGFSGKQVIHPNQVGPVQRAFTPSAEAIAQARRIVEAYAAHQALGQGAFALDGKMVDAPIVKAALRLLARARF